MVVKSCHLLAKLNNKSNNDNNNDVAKTRKDLNTINDYFKG